MRYSELKKIFLGLKCSSPAEEREPDSWKMQDCYILEHMRDVEYIPNAERGVQLNGTVCYFFGDTTIQVNETLQDGKRKLEPITGDQSAFGEWGDLSIDQVYGYCELISRFFNKECDR